MDERNHHYNRGLKEYASKLRNKSTKCEIILWSALLRASKMGVPFRRQRPVDRFIADFLCLPLKLIIEVYGISHTEPDVVARDTGKDLRLKELGYQILRLTDDEILEDLDTVRAKIEFTIRELNE